MIESSSPGMRTKLANTVSVAEKVIVMSCPMDGPFCLENAAVTAALASTLTKSTVLPEREAETRDGTKG